MKKGLCIGIILGMALMFFGCHSVQNLSVSDIRKDTYFYREYSLNMSIDDINGALYKYASNCRPLTTLSIDPSNKREAMITVALMGWTDVSIILVIDFKENPEGTSTVKAYSYYSGWNGYADKVIKAIQHPEECLGKRKGDRTLDKAQKKRRRRSRGHR